MQREFDKSMYLTLPVSDLTEDNIEVHNQYPSGT